ncbi:glycosyl hydrolase family 28 protein [Botryobacter ruber]|uniref:glycosyl hydrolase family 28 protein n=1 Tax=Botryobacter ruber TaxID=2171629 RepID=UPI00196B8389|nr:glycosyl hydrolase family 28 protein [Botryobacter ruber]
MRLLLLFVFCTVLVKANPVQAQTRLQTYTAPKGALLNDDFTVKVRIPGQKWQDLPEYLVKVDEVVNAKHTVKDASMASFDFSGKVEVMVTYNKGAIETARIRPLSYGIQHQVDKNNLTFTLDQPRNLSVEVNGDIFHNLHLFANPMLEFVPKKNDPNVIFFGPGIHEFKDQKFNVPSGKTVYISGDAVLRGQLLIHDARDVKVIGRGMVEHTVKMGVHIANSQNVLVEGIFLTQCATGGSDNVTLRNIKSISYYGWGDGLNVFASNNVLMDGVFCRNSDDCTTVYATRKGFVGGSKNITMQNSSLWADVAHPIFIGIHGNSVNPDVIENLNYVNIDILDHKEAQIDYQGCLAINGGDNNLIRNVRFEDIRIENFRQGQLVNIRIFYNPKYCTAPGKGIENLLFKNISYTGNNATLSIIAGYNEERKIKKIVFENLKINGEIIHDKMNGKPAWYKTSDMAGLFVGEHVEEVSFINTENRNTENLLK